MDTLDMIIQNETGKHKQMILDEIHDSIKYEFCEDKKQNEIDAKIPW